MLWLGQRPEEVWRSRFLRPTRGLMTAAARFTAVRNDSRLDLRLSEIAVEKSLSPQQQCFNVRSVYLDTVSTCSALGVSLCSLKNSDLARAMQTRTAPKVQTIVAPVGVSKTTAER